MYCIMRTEKRKRNALCGIQKEVNRSRSDHEEKGIDFDGSQIDWTKTDNNIYVLKNENWNRAITERLEAEGVKERKNSVVLIDTVFTASPIFFETHTQEEAADYFKDCLKFYINTFCQGDKTRIINCVIHVDETTSHMHIQSIPLYEDIKGMHLSAKSIMGNRAAFSNRQTEFFLECGLSRGMERGEICEGAEPRAHVEQRKHNRIVMEEENERLKNELSIRRQAAKAYETHKEAPEILSSTPEKKQITGKVIPATVTIKTEDFNRLEEMRMASEGIGNALNKMNELARKANTYTRVREAEARVKECEDRIQSMTTEKNYLLSTIESLKQEIQNVKEFFASFRHALEMLIPGIEQKVIELLQHQRERTEREQEYEWDGPELS